MQPFKPLSADEACDMAETGEALIVDIRDPQSYAAAHLPNAFNLDNSNIGEFLQQNDRAATVVVYCYRGHASQSAAAYLAEQGFAEVFSVEGGFEALDIVLRCR